MNQPADITGQAAPVSGIETAISLAAFTLSARAFGGGWKVQVVSFISLSFFLGIHRM